MRAGTMRERVTIEKSIPIQDEAGEPIDNWVEIPDAPVVWASILPRSSGERFISGAEQVQAEISHTVRIRHREDIDSLMRLVWGSRHLYIQSIVDPDGRTAESVLLCREVVGKVEE